LEFVMSGNTATSVEGLLGVKPAAGLGRLGLAKSILAGLPISALDRLAAVVAPDDAGFKFRLVPKATLERRKRSAAQNLTSEEGDRLARLAKVYVLAQDVYQHDEVARQFLNRPHAMLDDQTPLDVALATDPGADAVINLLGRIAYSGGV
jgi:putative toxin-antitoxin system antitoxin component (TIGR02293 family)